MPFECREEPLPGNSLGQFRYVGDRHPREIRNAARDCPGNRVPRETPPPNSGISRSTTGACACTIDVVSLSLFVLVIAFRGSFDAGWASLVSFSIANPPTPAIEAKDRSRGPKALTPRPPPTLE